MAWRSMDELNQEMVKNFKQMSVITTKQVENAFLHVPRAAFLPEYLHDEAYADYPVRGDDHLHMSAPHMYATVLEALDLKEGMSFLNIGSGTGYFSMLAGYIVGSQGINHGVELRANLVEHANECCDEFFMYFPKMKKKICYPQFIAGNCFHVDTMAQKYDRLYCGAACPRGKFDFLLEFVRPGGLVVVPSGNKLLKLERCVSTDVNEIVLSDVCFESLVLPADDEQIPKLRFTSLKLKTKKIKVYPPPGLLIPKTSARKSLSRLRALQDVVECFRQSGGSLPKAFAYVPSFAQLSKLTHAVKTPKSEQQHLPVDKTVNFFHQKRSKNSPSSTKNSSTQSEMSDALWSDIRYDTIWESVVDYTYSLCNGNQEHQQKCFQLYTKAKRKRNKKSSQPVVVDEHAVGGFLTNGKTNPDKYKHLVDEDMTILGDVSSKYEKGCFDSNSKQKYTQIEICSNVKSESETARFFERLEIGGDLPSVAETAIDLKSESSGYGFSRASEKSTVKRGGKASNDNENACSRLENNSKEVGKIGKEISEHKKGGINSRSAHAKKQLCPIEVDEYLTNELGFTPGPNWTCDEDSQLVQLLVKSHGGATSKVNSKCLPKHISILPSLFSPSVMVRYPKISSYPAESLTFRALALFRVVHVVDCVIPFLCSTSPNIDLVTRPLSERPYPLASFTESSFSTPVSQDEPISRVITRHENEADVTSEIKSILQNKRKDRRKESLQRKLDLRRSLTGRFKEQQSLIKKQMQLFEEQKAMLQHVELHAKHMSPRELEQFHLAQKRITEHKWKLSDLVDKHAEIAKEETQNEQEMIYLKQQIERLEKEEANVRQLIGGFGKMKRKLRWDLQQTRTTPFFSWDPDPTNSKSNASSILSSLRFLLPLSNRRAGILAELLRATEQPLPDQAPVVYVDRRLSVKERLNNPASSVFYQIFESLKAENMNFRWNKRKCDQWWEVKFVGEGIIDQGGGFRDSLSEISDELCPQEANINKTLPLIVKSVNNRDQVGDHRDCFVPNSSCKDLKAFHWMGKLMGATYRSDESLALFFPPYVWKLLVGEHVTWRKDFVNVDALAVNMINNIEVITKTEFDAMYADLHFTTAYSDGSIASVKENGSQLLVEYETRLEYCQLVKKFRMMEFVNQIKAIRDGILTVIPQSLLELITSQELERGTCGFNEISISLLKESVHYGDELSAESECVIQLWKVLENFSPEDRSRFLRFVTGRKRLPACVTLSQMCGEKDTLPGASTCASTLMLPEYSSVEVAEKKLRYAIYNCIAIDTDTSPW